MEIIIYVFLVLVGSAMGSFVGAVTWRMYAKKNFTTDRSECEKCHHKLSGADLIPVFSWLFLRGKCRYCGAKIGQLTLWLELGTAALFAMSYAFWPLGAIDSAAQIALFALWLVLVVGFVALAVYDARWFLLPNKIMFPLMLAALAFGLINGLAVEHLDVMTLAAKMTLGMLPVTGVYGVLYLMSRGKWVGLGDVKFGVIVGFLLPWASGLLVLVFANVIGTLVIIPLLAAKKLKRDSKVPFGPMLIVATFVVFLFGQPLVDWTAKYLFLM